MLTEEQFFKSQFKSLLDSLMSLETVYHNNGKSESYKTCEFFVQPVDGAEYPDYYQVITRPVCLTDIQRRVDQGEYQNGISDVLADIELMCDNAQTYNKPGSFAWIDANCIRQEARTMAAKLRKASERRRSEITQKQLAQQALQQIGSQPSQQQQQQQQQHPQQNLSNKQSQQLTINPEVLKPKREASTEPEHKNNKRLSHHQPTKNQQAHHRYSHPLPQQPIVMTNNVSANQAPTTIAPMISQPPTSANTTQQKQIQPQPPTQQKMQMPQTTAQAASLLSNHAARIGLLCVFCGVHTGSMRSTLFAPCTHLLACNMCGSICVHCPKCGAAVESRSTVRF